MRRLLQPSLVLELTAAAMVLTGSPALAQNASWATTRNDVTHMIQMSCTDPHTTLGIEHVISVTIDPDGLPTGGTVTFKGGMERPMGWNETMSYWKTLGGEEALWRDLENRGVTTSLDSPGPIPEARIGHQTMLVTTTGVDLVGNLLEVKPALYALQIPEVKNPVQFTRNGVARLEELNGTVS
jgi:hypothetical protein